MSSGNSPTLHIESFDWTNTKQRFFILGEIEDSIRIFLKVQQEHLFRGRRVLVLVGQDSMKPLGKIKLFQQPWDFVVRVRSNIDYSIIGAYLQNVPKPISILWIGAEIPSALLQKFDTGIHWICQSGTLPSNSLLTSVFISPSVPPFKYKEWLLSQKSHGHTQSILSSIEELREKKAGIVYNLTDHSIKWFDSAGLESAGGAEDITTKDLREVLIWCTDQLGFMADN